MKLYFNKRLITLTVVTSLLILGVVFFIGLELGRIAGGSERAEITDKRSENVSDFVKETIRNVQEAEIVPSQNR